MYIPKGPYEIKTGKHQGKVLEFLAFSEYEYLPWQLRQCRERSTSCRKNTFQEHLEWVILQGENRQPKMLCPYCKAKPVTRFSLLQRREGTSVGLHYICCDDCRNIVESMSPDHLPVFLPFRFSSFLEIWSRGDRRIVAGMFRAVFELPKPLTREAAFRFFAEEAKKNVPILWHKEQEAFFL